MDDRPTSPPPAPGERRLERPPSDRYREPEPTPPETPSGGSPARGVAFATIAAIVGAVAIAVAGEILTITAGLLVIAAVLGWGVAVGLRIGAKATLSKPRRSGTAIVLALIGVALGQVGVWLVSRAGGDVLGPIDYLGEAYGILVPLELVAAAIAAWLTAR